MLHMNAHSAKILISIQCNIFRVLFCFVFFHLEILLASLRSGCRVKQPERTPPEQEGVKHVAEGLSKQESLNAMASEATEATSAAQKSKRLAYV